MGLLTVSGHQWLYQKMGILHRDISLGNVLMRDDETAGFLCDLDLAIEFARTAPSGALAKTGTRPFMAMGLLDDAPHNFMHDLESFFWVLFWICVHHAGRGMWATKPSAYASWCTAPARQVANNKLGVVASEERFRKIFNDDCTAYYKPLLPVMLELRRALFPSGSPAGSESPQLYDMLKKILRSAADTLSTA
jgi:serine/threonine protein kinase